jgi:hypothetical protein
MPKFDAYGDVHVTEVADQSLQIPAEFSNEKEPPINNICNGMNLKGEMYILIPLGPLIDRCNLRDVVGRPFVGGTQIKSINY